MGTFFSAELVAPSSKYGRRIRVRNRHTGEAYFRPFPTNEGVSGRPLHEQIADKVRDMHHSPLFRPRILWYDKKLEMLFFELIQTG